MPVPQLLEHDARFVLHGEEASGNVTSAGGCSLFGDLLYNNEAKQLSKAWWEYRSSPLPGEIEMAKKSRPVRSYMSCVCTTADEDWFGGGRYLSARAIFTVSNKNIRDKNNALVRKVKRRTTKKQPENHIICRKFGETEKRCENIEDKHVRRVTGFKTKEKSARMQKVGWRLRQGECIRCFFNIESRQAVRPQPPLVRCISAENMFSFAVKPFTASQMSPACLEYVNKHCWFARIPIGRFWKHQFKCKQNKQ